MPAAHPVLTHACAECKRLKLKCDKQQPCGACIRRGCAEICPDGSLVAGRGTRFILSNTKELHDEVDRLRSRVRELEHALAELQSQLTPEPHPLLKQSLKVVSETLKPVEEGSKVDAVEDDSLIDTFGSLTIDPSGQTTWYGPHAGSEFFIPRDDSSANSTIRDTALKLPIDLLLLSKLFPLKSLDDGVAVVRARVRTFLPPERIARDISYTYHSRLAWSTAQHFWHDFVETIFDPIYQGDGGNDQQVAILFIVLSISVLLDAGRPMNHPDALQYYHLSRVSMSLGEDILQSRSLFAIQYMQLVGFYNGIANESNGTHRSWVATSIAIRIAQMAGLHRDNPQWDLYPEQAERRRRIWWELVAFETMQGFAMGRPRAINPAHYDTKLPHDDEDEGKPASFNRTKYRWIAEGLGAILDEAFAVKPPSYATTLKLDKTIRDWQLESIPSVEDVCLTKPIDINQKFMVILMRSFATTGLREIALMYLHRRYFVEALTRRPDEPLRSKYAMSVLAVHRSAVLLLQGIQRLDGLIGKLLPRIIFMWLHGLSAYVCLCAIVIKSPGCCLSRSCLVEIDRTKDLFSRVSAYRMAHAQPVILKLYEQAHLAMALYREGKWPPNDAEHQFNTSGDSEMDVMRFVGRSGFVSLSEPKESVSQASDTAGSSPQCTTAHPLLFEYLKQFQTEPDHNGAPTAEPPSAIGFPPEQSMLPPIMSGLDGMSFGDPFESNAVPPSVSSGMANGYLHASDPTATRQGMAAMDWSGMGASNNILQYLNDVASPNGMPTSFPYAMEDTATWGIPQMDPSAQIPDQVWQNFLTGLLPQEDNTALNLEPNPSAA